MQIPKDRNLARKLALPMTVVLFALLMIYALFLGIQQLQGSIQDDVGDEVRLAEVAHGSLTHRISAYGALKASRRRSLVAQVSGTITELLIKPGTPVEPNTVILRLANPRLEREYKRALLDVRAAEARLSRVESELMEKHSTLASEAKMRLAELKAKRAEHAAKTRMADTGAIGDVELEKSKTNVEVAELQHRLAKKRLEGFRETKKAQLDEERLRVEKAQEIAAMRKADVDALEIVAGMAGVLNSLEEFVALGGWIDQGKSLGVVANPESLYAELQVGASDAPRIRRGMDVRLNIKGQPAGGRVTRVAPNVVRNQVQIDVAIDSDLPLTARPDVEVNGEIVVDHVEDTLVLPRPVGFDPGKPLRVYVREKGEQFRLQKVKIGAYSGERVEVSSGLNAGDEVIVSDTARWLPETVITLN